MNKNMFKNVVIILLLGIATFSMFKYVSELKAIFRLQDSLTQTQDQVAVLAQEKQNLLQELDKEKELKTQLALKNKGLKDYLKASKDRIARLFHDNEVIQSDREEVLVKFSILKAENQALIDRQKRLYLANEQFKSKLSSVVELKKAIRELKSRKHKAPDLIAEGNQGFLIKDGRSNDLGNIKIEVVPARTKE
jgi:regulator of replication initiation timing